MATHKAAVFSEYGKPVEIKQVPRPRATAGSAVVRVLTTKMISYMDYVLSTPEAYPLKLPLTMGSIGIGRIEEVGQDAVSLKPGQLVFCDMLIRGRDDESVAILQGFFGGDPSTSSIKLMEGEWRDGCFAEYFKCPLENLYALDEDRLINQLGYKIEDLPFMSTCMVPYGGLADIGLKAGETIIIAPATGAFGGAAVNTALAMGAKVIAAGRNEEVLNKMKEVLGTTGMLETVVLSGDTETDKAAFLKANRGRPIDAFMDFCPFKAEGSHILPAILTLRKFGRVSLMGAPQANFSVPYVVLMHKCLRVIGTWMYTRDDVKRMIQLTEAGVLKLGKASGHKLYGPYKLQDWQEAIKEAEKHQGWGAMVVVNP